MTDAHNSVLFETVAFGSIKSANRVLMAPLTRNRANPDGTPGDLAAEYYTQRAGAGVIITEATQISPFGKGYLNTPGIHSPEQVAKWRETTEAVHAAGGKIVLQLWHVGRISHTSLLPNGEQPMAPSAIRAKSQTFIETGMTDVSEPRAMTVEDIKTTIGQYRQAAENAKAAGFDGVEVHGANGYLLDQFLRDGSNKRSDSYGGPVENRIRLLDEVVEAVVDVLGADRVGVRLSPTGGFNDMSDSNPTETFVAAAKALGRYGLAYLHVVEKFPGEEQTAENKTVIKAVRAAWSGAYIANGDYDADEAAAAIRDGHATAVAFGRPFIANPDLPKRFKLAADLNEPDQQTFYGGNEKGYTDYPALADEQAA
ncbi:MAG TPA: alkene reductase [Rhodospirillaceae bacterium]|nr:alkene reductase [Alphaproteobacteria bacterium]OUT41247.1 MAG: alkene reductase [Micavibrio sp. TMED2]HCI47713.1 alkene reductase [Rhodospirillaceae bacterium]MAS47232.1 alkene reductase [Alphaproteobacteria bacterium]MAX95325.1 alkene reductase [Alphaproteobacteria bacterium]|tara:strand:+ start:25041 stop:26147 length:1107 start_codon:yes stop_codon:yes gene_type:complete